MTTESALAAAFAHQSCGEFAAAAQVLRQILAADADNATAWNMLGGVACQAGEYEFALRCLGRSLQIAPEFAEAHCNLGTTLQELARLDEAVACFDRAIQLKPDLADAHYNLGNALRGQGKLDDALACYRNTVTLNPSFPEAFNNLGSIYCEQERWSEAAQAYCRALELRPDFAEANNGLGEVYQERGQLGAAIACFHRALVARPNFGAACSNLGSALFRTALVVRAAACGAPVAALLTALSSAGQPEEVRALIDAALRCANEARVVHPDRSEVGLDTRLVHLAKLILDQSTSCFEQAVTINPDSAAIHVKLADHLLMTGDFPRGWKEYEWRFKHSSKNTRRFSAPEWAGEPIAGRTLLVNCEQGLGDIFQFIRFAERIKRRGGRIIVECPRELMQLLASCAGIDQLIAYHDPSPNYDFHAWLLTLPRTLGTTLDSIPAAVPYLSPRADLVAQWRDQLKTFTGFRIGVNWQGRSGKGIHRQRDFPPDYLQTLAAVPGVDLISVQKGLADDPWRGLRGRLRMAEMGDDLDTVHGAFMDTAAIMMNLDLVITSDTSIAHLAGALGVPVWVALPFVPDWRWLLDRSDSPWYPTMRLFRQKQPGDWASVFVEIEAALRELVAERRLRPEA